MICSPRSAHHNLLTMICSPRSAHHDLLVMPAPKDLICTPTNLYADLSAPSPTRRAASHASRLRSPLLLSSAPRLAPRLASCLASCQIASSLLLLAVASPHLAPAHLASSSRACSLLAARLAFLLRLLAATSHSITDHSALHHGLGSNQADPSQRYNLATEYL